MPVSQSNNPNCRWIFFANILCSLTVPLITLGALSCAAVFLAERQPELISDINGSNVDSQIVRAQMRRLISRLDHDIVLFGDSSAVMGIDPAILEEKLARPVESFATLGVIGPEGYAFMLDTLAAQSTPFQKIFFVLHPIQFRRHPSWEGWIPMIKSWNVVPPRPPDSSPLDAVRGFTNRYLIYAPLPGAYALYYGSPESFVRSFNENKGSAIDPGTVLNVTTEEAFNAMEPHGYAPVDLKTFTVNESYRRALAHLKTSIAAVGRDKVYLLLGPLPLGPDHQQEIIDSFHEVAALLDLSPDHAIVPRLTFSLDAKHFSSTTHLNRYGKKVYSTALAEELSIFGARN